MIKRLYIEKKIKDYIHSFIQYLLSIYSLPPGSVPYVEDKMLVKLNKQALNPVHPLPNTAMYCDRPTLEK